MQASKSNRSRRVYHTGRIGQEKGPLAPSCLLAGDWSVPRPEDWALTVVVPMLLPGEAQTPHALSLDGFAALNPRLCGFRTGKDEAIRCQR